MVSRICGVSLKDRIPANNLQLRFGINSINDMLHWNRLRFHGHLLRMDDDAWPKKATMH